MHAAEFLIKSATTRWKELIRTGKLSGDAAGTLFRKGVLDKDYMLANSLKNTQRGLGWADILRPGALGQYHSPFANEYLEAARKLPSTIKPVKMLGIGGESLAIKTRDGNVLKMTLSGKPAPAPRAFDAPMVNPGGVIQTQTNTPVQWHVQPKLDILSSPDHSLVSTPGPAGFRGPRRPQLKGDEIAAQRFIKTHARGELKPTDVYPQKFTPSSPGLPITDAAPKVQQFGRMPDGRMVLADRGAISPHESVAHAYSAGDFNGPQVYNKPKTPVSLSPIPLPPGWSSATTVVPRTTVGPKP